MKVVKNTYKGTRAEKAAKILENFSPEEQKKVINFHTSIDTYKNTPLWELSSLAKQLDVRSVLVKDESFRCGLNAFKALGGSYAIGKYLAGRLGVDISDLPYSKMISDEVREKLGDITFVTATDGNHGRGVAWTANKLQQKCVVHMPRGTAKERLDNIKALGAKADITDLNYDDAVRLANSEAEKNGWVLVQDTSWDGYEEIPMSIIQGYTTFLSESFGQISVLDGDYWPTHAFVQAGVGALSTAFVAAFVQKAHELKKPIPIITIIEPENAACVFETLSATDGKIHNVGGELKTIMAGLACGEPVTVGVDLLANYVDYVVSAEDYIAAQGMRRLAEGSRGKDTRIISGESGAAAFGFAYEVLSRQNEPEFAKIKSELKIDLDSVLYFVSTEGDTDKVGYDNIVVNGAYPRP